MPGTADVRSLGGAGQSSGLSKTAGSRCWLGVPLPPGTSHWETRQWDFSKIHTLVASLRKLDGSVHWLNPNKLQRGLVSMNFKVTCLHLSGIYFTLIPLSSCCLPVWGQCSCGPAGLSSQRTRSERLIRQLQTRDGIRPSAVIRQAGKGPRHGPLWSVEFTVFGLQSRRGSPVCFFFFFIF